MLPHFALPWPTDGNAVRSGADAWPLSPSEALQRVGTTRAVHEHERRCEHAQALSAHRARHAHPPRSPSSSPSRARGARDRRESALAALSNLHSAASVNAPRVLPAHAGTRRSVPPHSPCAFPSPLQKLAIWRELQYSSRERERERESGRSSANSTQFSSRPQPYSLISTARDIG